MQTTINNGDTGYNTRAALNSMFTELYSNIAVPKKLTGISANTTYQVIANTYLSSIEAASSSGSPTLRIGTTANGTEIMEDTLVGPFANVKVDTYFSAIQTLYISVTGTGSLNIRIDQINNYF